MSALLAAAGPKAGMSSCGRCGGPVIATWSAATGVPLRLDPELIDTVAVRHREEIRSTAAAVGYRLMADGSASVACAPGPAGYAGAGDSYDVHQCPRRLVGPSERAAR